MDIRKSVETERVEIPVDLLHEEVSVSCVDVQDRPDGTLRVPVRGEQVVAQQEAVVTVGVVIGQEQRTERQTGSDTVRQEEVEVKHTEGVQVHHRRAHIPHSDKW